MPRATAFQTSHPAVPALCMGGAMLVGMLVFQPVYTAVSLVGSVMFSLLVAGPRDFVKKLAWMLPMLALVCLANPIFSASGSTELLRIGPAVVYAESLAYGACMGALLVSTLLWFEAMAAVLTPDMVLSTAGRALPTVSLVVSMAMGLVPQLLRRVSGMRHTLRACTCAQEGRRGEWGMKGKLDEAARISTMLVSWSLEDSLERSDAMRARGWRAGTRRTSYRSHQLRDADKIALAVLALLLAASGLLGWVALGQWHFYPSMPRLVVWWGYVPYVLLSLLPAVACGVDRMRWARIERRGLMAEEGV